MLTFFGAFALALTMLAYAFERRHRGFVLAFAALPTAKSVIGVRQPLGTSPDPRAHLGAGRDVLRQQRLASLEFVDVRMMTIDPGSGWSSVWSAGTFPLGFSA